MKVTTSSTYTVDMVRCVYVQIKGTKKPARIPADGFEKVDGTGGALNLLVLKSGDKIIGEIKGSEVQGWWFQDE